VLANIESIIVDNDFLTLDKLICGDFNARTGNLGDFITCNDNIPFFQEYVNIVDSSFYPVTSPFCCLIKGGLINFSISVNRPRDLKGTTFCSMNGCQNHKSIT